MQLNIYVPEERAGLLAALDEAVRRTGRKKNQLVLDALEAYLAQVRPELGVFELGVEAFPPRDEIHLERWKP